MATTATSETALPRIGPDASDSIRPVPMLATVVAAAALGAAVWGSHVAALVALAAVGLGLCLTWPVLACSHTRRASIVVMAIGLAGVVLAARDRSLDWIGVAVAVGLLAAFAAQLFRGSDRSGLVTTVAGSAAGLVMLAGGGLLAAMGGAGHGREYAAVVLAACAGSVIADLCAPSRVLAPLVPVVAGALGAALGALTVVLLDTGAVVSTTTGAWLGLLAGMLCASVRRILSTQPSFGVVPSQVASGLASVLLTGSVAHLLFVLAG